MNPDDFTRAVEATLFASAEPLTPDEIARHTGEGDVDADEQALHGHRNG